MNQKSHVLRRKLCMKQTTRSTSAEIFEVTTYNGSQYHWCTVNLLTFNSDSNTGLWAFTKLIVRNTAISPLIFLLDADKCQDACTRRTDQFTVTIELIFG